MSQIPVLIVLAILASVSFGHPLNEANNAPLVQDLNITSMELFLSTEIEVRPGYQQFGDMILPQDYFEKAAGKKPLTKWPKGEVPYVIEKSIAAYTANIEKAIRQYNSLTCLKFVPRTTQRDYLTLGDGAGCNSYVGKAGGSQKVNLQKPAGGAKSGGCIDVGTIVHELGHAIGLIHEHQRSDRDKYITVNEKNVQDGQLSQFTRVPESGNELLAGYELSSIMHYGNNAFSKNGKDTMTAKNGKVLLNPYAKPGLTTTDVASVKKLYGCK